MAERRKHQRFDFKEKCLLRHASMVGTVIDLSLGGLSCCCANIDDDNCHAGPKVDLFCTGKKIWVRGLTVEIIESEKIPGQFLDNFSVRKCRGRFENLQPEQATQLEDLILAYAGH